MEEGDLRPRRARLAGHQQLGNLVLLYDDNHISIEGNTEVAFSEDVVARYEAYGWHVQQVDRRPRTSTRCATRSTQAREPRPTGRRSSRCARSSAGRPRTCRTPARRTAPRSAPTRSRQTKEILGLDPDDELPGPGRGARARPRGRRPRPRRARGVGEALRRTGAAANAERRGTARPDASQRRLPDGWEKALPDLRPPTRRAWRPARPPARSSTRSAPCCPSCGAARPTSPRATTPRWRAQISFEPDDRRRPRPVRPDPALRHPRARHGLDHERHRRCTAAPGSTAARSCVFSDYMRGRSGSPR